MFDIVYAWKTGSVVQQVGHNYVIYDECTRHSLRMQVGVPVSERFADTDLVKCVDFTPGKAAHATHVGSYAHMHLTYKALREWCSRESILLDGQSWEVYGDWNDDISKVTTDIYLRLK